VDLIPGLNGISGIIDEWQLLSVHPSCSPKEEQCRALEIFAARFNVFKEVASCKWIEGFFLHYMCIFVASQ
jgi:hypothetical protein